VASLKGKIGLTEKEPQGGEVWEKKKRNGGRANRAKLKPMGKKNFEKGKVQRRGKAYGTKGVEKKGPEENPRAKEEVKRLEGVETQSQS